MKWINFLHFYQPVNKDAHVIQEATEMSYKRVIRALEKNKNIKFTLNINGCLFLRWEELGYHDLIKRIKKLLEKGQIEITGTACYHPLLPLVPERETERQVKENEEILKKHFGKYYKPKGFFFPEMAYHQDVAKLVKKLGYKWAIVDEITAEGKLGKVDNSKVFLDKNSGLKIVFRSRQDSSTYVPREIPKLIKNRDFVLTGTDGELYGLRYVDKKGYIEKVMKTKGLETETISNFMKAHKNPEEIKLVSSTWESTEEELEAKKPYQLWDDKAKQIQQKIWELARLAYETIEENGEDDNYYWARWHLVRGLASCTFWWASEKDFKKVFGPHAWNPDEIERGTNELIRSVRALENEDTREMKLKAEKMYVGIKKLVWEQHWTYYWKKNS